jgi:thiamine biosynthesis protein ThiS
MITVYLNNKIHQMESCQSLYDFLIQNAQLEQHFAIILNNKLIARRDFKTTFLQSNDCVDILVPMQGG